MLRITLVGGRTIDLDRITPDDIRIEEIAHSLSNLCHWGGHTRHFFSVAEHSCLVAARHKANPLEGLLHDACEAYVGDMIRPIKRLMPAYREIEKIIWMNAVAPRFGLDPQWSADLGRADNEVLYMEAVELMGVDPKTAQDWFHLPAPVTYDAQKLQCLPPRDAYRYFMLVYDTISSGRFGVQAARMIQQALGQR